jgi:hypothetical protein
MHSLYYIYRAGNSDLNRLGYLPAPTTYQVDQVVTDGVCDGISQGM